MKEAKVLKRNWTEIIEKRVELKEKGTTIDVKVDALTASFRQKAVTLMLDALQIERTPRNLENLDLVGNSKLQEDDSKSHDLIVVELVEKYLFLSNSKRTSNTYRKSVRKITFDLKSNKHQLRERLTNKSSETRSYKFISNLIKDHLTQ